jgi:serine/threonine-protein kinase
VAWFSFKRSAVSSDETGQAEPALLAGRYRLGATLGSGSAGVVREAIDMRTSRVVAVKLITLPHNLPAQQRQEWTNRLQREAELARRLEHPDIVTVYETGLQADRAWLIMEKVSGHDLSRYTVRHRLLPEVLVLRIGARVAAALGHAHSQGVVHRDLKPANVLVNLATGLVKLADFGVAHLPDAIHTQTGMTLGTPAYMAPEQLIGASPTAASDAYSLGVMRFEMLAGRRPHHAATLGELLQATAHQEPASLAALRPDVPRSAVALVEQLLAREPTARPTDLSDWAAQMAALAAVMMRVQPATMVSPL